MWRFAAFLLVASSAAGAGSQPQLEFGAPGQFDAQARIAGLDWALFVFRDSDAVLDFQFDGQGTFTNTTHLEARTHSPPATDHGKLPVPKPPETQAIQGPVQGTASFTQGWSSVVVFADHLDLDLHGKGNLYRVQEDTAIDAYLENHAAYGTFRTAQYAVADEGAAFSALGEAVDFHLTASGPIHLEWHNATVQCSTADCPDGGAYHDLAPSPSAALTMWQRTYIEAQFPNGTLDGSGSAYMIVAGGRILDAEVNGTMRLPRATLTGSCNGQPCANPGGRAFLAEGVLRLNGLQPAASEDRLTTAYDADLSSVKFDETPVLFTAAGGLAAGVAATIGLGLIAKLLAFLFARKTGPVLEHPSSKQLFEAIQASPGQSFRELRRQLGWGGGQLATHLRRLEGAKLIVRREHGNTTRFFENHGRFDQSWKEVTVLQDPECRAVHDWLVLNPGATQRALVDHAEEAWGLGRRRIQVILRHLQDAQLLSGIRTGRVVRYSAQPFASQAGDAGAVTA